MDGYRPCNHKCHNKDVCGHDCCKTGIPTKPARQVTSVQKARQDMKNRLKEFPAARNTAAGQLRTVCIELILVVRIVFEYGFVPHDH